MPGWGTCTFDEAIVPGEIGAMRPVMDMLSGSRGHTEEAGEEELCLELLVGLNW